MMATHCACVTYIKTLCVVICPFLLGQIGCCPVTYIRVQCASFFICPKLAALRDLAVLGSFTKLRKETTGLVMCVCLSLSVRMEQPGSHWMDFIQNLYLIFFSPENLLKEFLSRITGTLHEDLYSDTSANEDNSLRVTFVSRNVISRGFLQKIV